MWTQIFNVFHVMGVFLKLLIFLNKKISNPMIQNIQCWNHLLYYYNCPSVCQLYLGETWSSRPLIKIEAWFFLCSFLSYMSIYYINIVSRQYVSKAIKGLNFETLISLLCIEDRKLFHEDSFDQCVSNLQCFFFSYLCRLGFKRKKYNKCICE